MNKKQLIGLILLVAAVGFDALALMLVVGQGNKPLGAVCMGISTVFLFFGAFLFVRGKREQDGR